MKLRRCQIEFISFSAHVDYTQNSAFIRTVSTYTHQSTVKRSTCHMLHSFCICFFFSSFMFDSALFTFFLVLFCLVLYCLVSITNMSIFNVTHPSIQPQLLIECHKHLTHHSTLLFKNIRHYSYY